jgi:hypothetical protein
MSLSLLNCSLCVASFAMPEQIVEEAEELSCPVCGEILTDDDDETEDEGED